MVVLLLYLAGRRAADERLWRDPLVKMGARVPQELTGVHAQYNILN